MGAWQVLRSSWLEEQVMLKHPWQASPDRHAKRDAGDEPSAEISAICG